MTTPPPAPPRELEPLRRASIVVLIGFRIAAGVLGLCVIGFATWYGVRTDDGPGAGIAYAALGWSFGLPLLMPLPWQKRRLPWLLPVFLLLWAGPIAVDPQPLAFILRMFASGVAWTALILWDLLQGLTRPGAPAAPPTP